MNLEKQLMGEIWNLEKECKGCEDYHLGKEGMRCYNQGIIQEDCDTRGKLQALKSTLTKLQKARKKLENGIEEIKMIESGKRGNIEWMDSEAIIFNKGVNKTLSLIKEVLGSGKEH